MTILNLEVNRLSLHQPEYEMDRTDYPVDYNFLEIGYCGHPTYPHTSIQLEQDSDLILSYFQEGYHSVIDDTLIDKNTKFIFLYYIYKPKKKRIQEGYYK